MLSTSAVISVCLILFSTYFFVNIVYNDFLLQKKQRDRLIEDLRAAILHTEKEGVKLVEQKISLKLDILKQKKVQDSLVEQEELKLHAFRIEIQDKSSKILEHNRQKFQQNFQALFDGLVGPLSKKIGGE